MRNENTSRLLKKMQRLPNTLRARYGFALNADSPWQKLHIPKAPVITPGITSKTTQILHSKAAIRNRKCQTLCRITVIQTQTLLRR